MHAFHDEPTEARGSKHVSSPHISIVGATRPSSRPSSITFVPREALIMKTLVLTSLLALGAGNSDETRLPAARLIALLPRGLTSFGAEALDGWVYVFGGYHGEPHNYSREGQSDEFYRVNLRDPRQVEQLDGGVAIQGAMLATWKGKLIRAGGMVARNSAGATADLHSVADVSMFDPMTRAWQALPPMPEARSSHDIEISGDQLVVLGGWTLDGDAKKKFASTVARLDLAHVDRGWTSVEAPFRRRAFSAARLGARLAAIGGIDSEGEISPKVDVFDPSSGTWTSAPDFPGPPFGVAAASIGGAVYASGKDAAVWRLEADGARWTRAGTLCFPRFFHQMVAVEGGSLLALGGIDDMRKGGRIRHVERLDPRSAATPQVSSFEVPAPCRARNRQGAFLRNDVLTLFGGNRSLKQHDFGREDFQDECWSLDIATLAWTRRADFPEGRQTISTTIAPDGTTGFAVGGFGFAGDKAIARDSGYRYSFEHDAWQRAESLDLPIPRTQFGLIDRATDLWIFGGLDYDPSRGDDAFVHPLEILSLDLGDESKRMHDTGVRLTTPRRAFACALLGDRAYLVGGMREAFDIVEECESFDFATHAFKPIAAPRRPRVSAELVALGAKLYLCGGSSRGADGKLTPDASIESYDATANRWDVVIERLPEPMPHMHAFALRDRILLVTNHVEGPPTTRLVIIAP